ncbi:hypothetical protein IW147_002902 [Coemansia sp. RSA 720]|nr:hypothetical protein IW147_002902 [Coemansia sp. RSA 720]
MESKYKSIKHIGEGAFSSVLLALNVETGEKVAIKKMKKRRWKDTAAQAEISALQKLNHENIIQLLDVFREDYRSFLVFECMDCDLNELVVSRNGRRLPDTVILDITYQILNGLDYIHRSSLFHRDIKPENVLIRRHVTSGGADGNSSIIVEAKIADFGLVHDLDFSRPLTDYISTRWYRAPEVLLNCTNYTTPIDVWAVGTIIAELATLRPLFPGANQIDQLRRIFEVLGTPRISAPNALDTDGEAEDPGSWYEGAVHARKLGIAFVPSQRKPLQSVMPEVSGALTQLIDYLLVLNPATRPTAQDGLALVSRMLDQHLGEPQANSDDARVPGGSAQDEAEFRAVPHPVLEALSASSDQVAPATQSKPAPLTQPKPMTQTQLSPSFGPVSASAASDHEPASPPAVPELPLANRPANGQMPTVPPHVQLSVAPPSAVNDGRISFTPRDQFVLEQAQHQKSQQAQQAQLHNKQKTAGPEPGPSMPYEHKSAASSFVSVAPPVITTSRPSVEVNIVKSLHREPIRDPRGDLSDLLVRPSMPMPAVVAGPSQAMARRIVLPHMRATTPVSASVPAPKIVPRGTSELLEYEYISVNRSDTNSSSKRDKRPPRLGIAADARVSLLRGRSYSASTEGSVTSAHAQSIVVSPTSSHMSRGSDAFSLSDIPSPTDNAGGLRIYGDAPSAIGKSSLMTVLAQQEPWAAIDKQPDVHIRKAPSIATARAHPGVAPRNAEKRKSDLVRVGQEHAPGMDGFVPLRSPAVSSGSAQAGSRYSGLVQSPALAQSPAALVQALALAQTPPAMSAKSDAAPSPTSSFRTIASTNGTNQAKQGGKQRLLGLRNKSGLGSPLIRRALSMKKKNSREDDVQAPAQPVSIPEDGEHAISISNVQPAESSGQALLGPTVKRSHSALAPNKHLLNVGDFTGHYDLSAEAQAALEERILKDSEPVCATLTRPPSRAKKDEWINNTQLMRQRLKTDDVGASASSTISAANARKRRSSNDAGWLMQSIVDGGLFGSSPNPGARSRNSASEPTESNVLEGLDTFAPVTFDVNALFRQSLLDSRSSQSPSVSSPGMAMSPDYMATFSDVRRKYSESRTAAASAAAAVAAEHAGTHRFLSKVKNALTGRHAQAPRERTDSSHRRRNDVREKHRSSSDAAARPRDCAPRLDFDLESNLMTPESLHHQRVQDEYTLVDRTHQTRAPVAKAVEPANDSAYYLIDYINSQDADNVSLHPAARRVVNTSTRARQTQYDYNYGSQIFETLDKDSILLKTDLFRDFELGLDAVSNTAPSAASSATTRLRKRPADVTAATAYTAAAINSIVAHNAKARSSAVSPAAAGNARSQLGTIVI